MTLLDKEVILFLLGSMTTSTFMCAVYLGRIARRLTGGEGRK